MKDLYSDFDVEFNLNKKTKDVNIKRNLESIKQSLWCLLQTNFYDRKWHPEIGSYFPKMLFSLGHPELFHLLESLLRTKFAFPFWIVYANSTLLWVVWQRQKLFSSLGIDIDHH